MPYVALQESPRPVFQVLIIHKNVRFCAVRRIETATGFQNLDDLPEKSSGIDPPSSFRGQFQY